MDARVERKDEKRALKAPLFHGGAFATGMVLHRCTKPP
jgi:hypothetical protein